MTMPHHASKYTFEAFGEGGNMLFNSTVLNWDDVSALLRAVTIQSQICAANVYDGSTLILVYNKEGVDV